MLEKILQENKKCILIDDSENRAKDLWSILTEYVHDKSLVNNQVFLVSSDLKCQIGTIRICTEAVPEDELRSYINLWRTYEFSDRFTVISEDPHFGSMLNYVENGLISWYEYFDTLLAE